MVISFMATEHSKITTDQREKESDRPQPSLAVQILGEFPENLPERQEGLLLTFLPSSFPLKKRWRTNGLSADFLADYLTTFLPGDEDLPEAIAKQTEFQSAVSYIANELLENAMKFSNPGSSQPVCISLHLYPGQTHSAQLYSAQLYSAQLVFLVTNSIDAVGVQKYRSFIQEVSASDPSAMLLRRLEQSVEEQEHQSSGLGLVTILHDYPAKLGWKFENFSENLDDITVTTAVQLSI